MQRLPDLIQKLSGCGIICSGSRSIITVKPNCDNNDFPLVYRSAGRAIDPFRRDCRSIAEPDIGELIFVAVHQRIAQCMFERCEIRIGEAESLFGLD